MEQDITVRIQKKSLERENERVAQLQEEQLKEKAMIFEKLLPESMLHTFLKDNADEERIELEKLRQDLEQINADRVRELEEQKRLEEEVLLKGQAAVDALAAKQQKAKEDQDRLDRALHDDQRKKESKMTAEDHIKEVMK